MRILITKEGTEVIQQLDNLTKYSTLNKITPKRYSSVNVFNRTNKTFKRTIRLKYNLNSSQNSLSSNYLSPQRNRSQLIDLELKIPNKNDIKNATFKKVNITKVSFSKKMAEKYDNNSLKSNIISETNKIPSSIIHNNSSEILNKNNIKIFSFNEIIPNKSLNRMKIKLIKDKKMKDKLSKIDENNFRSSYSSKTDLEKLDDILSFPKINSTKVGLIKYLNQSKFINPTTLKNLLHSNPLKINKMNKIAQILINEEQRQKLHKNIIQNKLKNQKKEESIYINNQINNMKDQMLGFKERLHKYQKKFEERDRYKDIFNDIVINYWNKYDYDKLNKKGSPKHNYRTSFYLSQINDK